MLYFFRYGFSTPPNYNDHELYCGGFTRQWQTNGGKCGICGDAWDMPVVSSSQMSFHLCTEAALVIQVIFRNYTKN